MKEWKSSYVVIPITDEIKKRAMDYVYIQFPDIDTKDYSYLEKKNIFMSEQGLKEQQNLGNIAKICFEVYINSVGFPEQRYVPVFKKASEFDFIINNKTIKVKEGHLKWPIDQMTSGYRPLLPEQQRDFQQDYYINIQISPEMHEAYICGYLPMDIITSKDTTQDVNCINPHMDVYMSDLKPIEELVDILKGGLKRWL